MEPEMWKKPLWERVWPYLDPWDSVRLRTASTHWNVPKKYGPHGELSSFSSLKSRWSSVSWSNSGSVSQPKTVKACALIGLHMVAEENALLSDSDSSPDLGDMWRYGFPKSPVWGSNGVEWAGNEDASSLEYHEHNVDNLAIEVVGQN